MGGLQNDYPLQSQSIWGRASGQSANGLGAAVGRISALVSVEGGARRSTRATAGKSSDAVGSPDRFDGKQD